MINEYLSDIEKPVTQVLYSDISQYAQTYYNFNVYNPLINMPLQKFWLFINKAKVIKLAKDNITIAVSYQDNSKLVNYISSVENYIFNDVKKIIAVKTIKKTIINDNNPIIKLNCCSSIPTFTNNNVETNYSAITIDSYISLFIELEQVVVARGEIFFIWTVLQIKQIEYIDFRKSLFNSNHMSNTKSYNSHTPLSNNTHLNNHIPHNNYTMPPQMLSPPPPPPPINTTLTQEIRPVLHISASDLLSQISKLKKKSEINIPKTELTKLEPVTQLKKIVPKEPLPVASWYNLAKDSEILFKISKNYHEICASYKKMQESLLETENLYENVVFDYELLFF